MKIFRFIPFVIVPLLFSCIPKKPEIPMIEVPAGPLVQALEQRSRSFSSLKALAGIQVVKKDRKRSFESVGILLNKQERFKIEVYGPLGQTLITLLWNGNDVLLDYEGRVRTIPSKSPVLERVLGADVDPAELCAILSGNIPGMAAGSHPRLLCAQDGRCVLELREDDMVVRVHQNTGWESAEINAPNYEVYRGGKLLYQVRFESFERLSGYALPKKIVVENPAKRMSLLVEYSDAEVNRPLDIRTFSMPQAEDLDR